MNADTVAQHEDHGRRWATALLAIGEPPLQAKAAHRLAPWANDPEVSDQYRDAVARCRSAFDELVGRGLVVRTRRLDDK